MFLLWIVFAPIVGFIGSDRKIGFWGALFCSLLLSPVIGLIITLLSKTKKDEQYQEKMLELQKKQQKTLNNLQQSANVRSILKELEDLKKLKDEGILDENEFNKLKQKALANAVIENDDDSDFEYQIEIDDHTQIFYNEEERIEGDNIHSFISFSDGSGGDIWGNKLTPYTAIENNEELIYYKNKESALRALFLYISTGKVIPDNRI